MQRDRDNQLALEAAEATAKAFGENTNVSVSSASEEDGQSDQSAISATSGSTVVHQYSSAASKPRRAILKELGPHCSRRIRARRSF